MSRNGRRSKLRTTSRPCCKIFGLTTSSGRKCTYSMAASFGYKSCSNLTEWGRCFEWVAWRHWCFIGIAWRGRRGTDNQRRKESAMTSRRIKGRRRGDTLRRTRMRHRSSTWRPGALSPTRPTRRRDNRCRRTSHHRCHRSTSPRSLHRARRSPNDQESSRLIQNLWKLPFIPRLKTLCRRRRTRAPTRILMMMPCYSRTRWFSISAFLTLCKTICVWMNRRWCRGSMWKLVERIRTFSNIHGGRTRILRGSCKDSTWGTTSLAWVKVRRPPGRRRHERERWSQVVGWEALKVALRITKIKVNRGNTTTKWVSREIAISKVTRSAATNKVARSAIMIRAPYSNRRFMKFILISRRHSRNGSNQISRRAKSTRPTIRRVLWTAISRRR